MTLSKLFYMLGNNEKFSSGYTDDFFEFSREPFNPARRYEQADINLVTGLFSNGFNCSALCKLPAEPQPEAFWVPMMYFYDLSINAFYMFIHAWLSELPIEAELLNFGRRVITAADNTNGSASAKRLAADKISIDRGDENTRTVLAAAHKVQCEIHRMMGLLRFNPDETGVFIARCAPDHFVIPALGDYFNERFGEAADWAVIDEKRDLYLHSRREAATSAKILPYKEAVTNNNSARNDKWEELWQHYHKTINNEDRNNPDLQRQLMPKRYWKYLPEIQ